MTFSQPIGPPDLLFAGSHAWQTVAGEPDALTAAVIGDGVADYLFFQGQHAARLQCGAVGGSIANFSASAGGLDRYPPEGIDTILDITFLMNIPATFGEIHAGWLTTTYAGNPNNLYGFHIARAVPGVGPDVLTIGASDSGLSFINPNVALAVGWHKVELLLARTSLTATIDDLYRWTRKETFTDARIAGAFIWSSEISGGANFVSYFSKPTYRYRPGQRAIG